MSHYANQIAIPTTTGKIDLNISTGFEDHFQETVGRYKAQEEEEVDADPFLSQFLVNLSQFFIVMHQFFNGILCALPFSIHFELIKQEEHECNFNDRRRSAQG